jgi:hypothetical protein
MQSESKVYFGNYGCATTKERQQRDSRRARSGKPWHSSMSPEEITKLFIAWGIIGRYRTINPIIKLIPYFDRGPGFAGDKGDV